MFTHQRSQPHMDAAILFNLPANPASHPLHQSSSHYSYLPPDRVADRRPFADNSSFLRSSAPRQMHNHFLSSSFRSTYPMPASTSSSFAPGSSPAGSPFELAPEPDLRAHALGGQPYQPEHFTQSWGISEQPSHPQYADQYASSSYDIPPLASASTSTDPSIMHSSIKSEEHQLEAFGNMYMTSYADMQNAQHLSDHHQHSPLNSFALPLPAFHESGASHQLGYPYAPDDQSHTGGAQDVANLTPFMLAAPTSQLHYPEYPQDVDVPRYVNPTQVSPAISPTSPFMQLQDVAPSQSLDPRFTLTNSMHTLTGAGSGGSSSDFTDFEVESSSGASGSDSPAMANAIAGASAPIPMSTGIPLGDRKRQRSVSFTSSEEEVYHQETSGGESEHEDDEDDEYIGSPQARRQAFTPSMSSPTTSTGSGSMSVGGRRLAPPVPVPNLTKKSRGRRVPTAQQVVSEGALQKVRCIHVIPRHVCVCVRARGVELVR